MNMTLDRKSKSVKIGLIVIVCLFVYFIFHQIFKSKGPVIPTPVVIVKKPQMAEMAEYITQTGNTVAYNSVDLVARVEGYLNEVKFTDGSFVKKGQALFVIEPDPYQEKVDEAQAEVMAKKAALAYAKAEYARQQQMYKENATSLNNVEKWLAQRDEAQAQVAQAVANAEVADINYSYTHIVAPFDGRIGRHLVDPGNLVGNGKATDLATIEQIDPIYVYFNLNELDLIKVREAAHAAGIKPSEVYQVPVSVAMQNEKGFPHAGTLNFVNTGLNASTGTIEFRALLPNKQYTLLPGLFVQVRVAISKPTPQLTVPDTAVLYDQIGSYLLTVDKNNIVLQKRIVTGSLEQGMRAIIKGLDAQDRVIVDGLQNATPGNVVAPKEQTG